MLSYVLGPFIARYCVLGIYRHAQLKQLSKKLEPNFDYLEEDGNGKIIEDLASKKEKKEQSMLSTNEQKT